jgi:hypothetical protein
MTMKVDNKVFLEQGNKRVTMFSIVPETGRELQAVKMLHNEALNYVCEKRILHNKFIESDNPFTLLIVEGINE